MRGKDTARAESGGGAREAWDSEEEERIGREQESFRLQCGASG